MKRIWTCILALALVFGCFSTMPMSAEASDNNSSVYADWINVNTPYTDSIRDYNDPDWFTFTLAQQGYVSFTFMHDLVDSTGDVWEVYLYDEELENTLYWCEIYGNKVTTKGYKIGLPAGKYYVKVCKGWYGDYGYNVEYSLTVNATYTSVWESEPNNSWTSVDKISTGKYYNGIIKDSNDSDWYRFTLSSQSYITFTMKHDLVNSTGDVWGLYLYNDELEDFYNWDIVGSKTTTTTCKVGLPKGTYYVKVRKGWYGDYGYGVPYSLKVDATATSAWESEENNDFTTADKIGLEKKYYGLIMNYNDHDWYKLSLSKTTDLLMTFTHNKVATTGDVWGVYVYNSEINQVESWEIDGNQTTVKERIKLKKGTYYIKICKGWYGDHGYGVTYGMTFSYYLSTPKVSTSNLSNGIQVKWNKVSNASGYIVYRKTGSGAWRKLGKTTNKYYTDKTAKVGKTYKYTVKAYKSKSYSGYNKSGVALKRLTIPKLKTAASSKKGITVKWSKVTGASGYIVYRKTGSGKWVKLKTVKGSSKVSYLDKTAKKGKTYRYTVRAYSGKSKGSYNTNGIKIKDRY